MAKDVPQSSAYRIAIHVGRDNAYGYEILRGLAAFAQTRTTWQFVGNPAGSDNGWKPLSPDWCDGVIVYTAKWSQVDDLVDSGVPFVNTTSRRLSQPCPLACPDNIAIGRSGAEHLCQTGARRLAFLARRGPSGDIERRDAFQQACVEDGREVLSLDLCSEGEVNPLSPESLQTVAENVPLAIMCATDRLAVHMIHQLHGAGIRVPDDVAVLGSGNDELTCTFVHPALSSLDIGAFEIGYAAGQLLQDLLNGRAEGCPIHKITPSGVEERESTRMIIAADRALAEAIRFVREHACKGIDVRDVVARGTLTRRSLERGFREVLGLTPLQEIRRIQLANAKEMLAGTDLPIGRVAHQVGVEDARYFSQMFRKALGQTPSQFRRAAQAQTPRDPRPAIGRKTGA
ncbi:MAG: substrate-binding domain-containing protein [Phycisphaerae bacterium]